VPSFKHLKPGIKNPRRLARNLLAASALAAVAWFVAPFCVPLPGDLLANPAASPVFRDRHGTVISHLPLPDSIRSAPVTLDMIPPDLIACTIAAEDKRFFEHGGVDFLATIRAARDLIAKRRVVSGASTITQQLIKISSPPANRSPATKLYEILAARRLEMNWSKDQILIAYLNRLDYGNLRRGSAEAARFYFQKPLADLSLAECALLAGLPQAPSRLNPMRNPERATTRRNTVLNRLAATGKSDPARITAALAEPLSLQPLRESQPAPWLASLSPPHTPAPDLTHTSAPPSSASSPTSATGSLLHPATGTSPAKGSSISYLKYEIETTLDLSLQKDLEAMVRSETAKLKEANLRHAAAVVIHNPTGEILALVSSADWNDPRGGQINGALAPRSPGSTLKPFTYLLAMEHNQRIPASILADIPSSFRTPQGLDLPENYDRAYRGPVTLRSALACSLNIPAMRELNALGGPAPLHQLLTTLGLTTLGPDPTADGLGLTVGNAPVRLLELTNAYATLARGGRHLPPVLFPAKKHPPTLEIPFSAASFYLLADILSDPSARAPSFPPGGPLDLPFRCAVKTGTSSDFRDNWCIGYTPEFTIGVWAGNFESQPMKGLSGIAGAAPVFHQAMLRLHRNHPPSWFNRPDGLVDIAIDRRNGKLIPADSNTPNPLRDLAPDDRLPPVATAADYDSTGKALLDPAFTAWFESPHNLRRGELALDPSPSLLEPLKVITPADGITLLLDPEIPSGSGRLRPVTNLPGTARWSSPTLRIESAMPEPVIHLAPGTHTLTATDPRTGTSQDITVHVKAM
jgi:penicillin-binding protein 1C